MPFITISEHPSDHLGAHAMPAAFEEVLSQVPNGCLHHIFWLPSQELSPPHKTAVYADIAQRLWSALTVSGSQLPSSDAVASPSAVRILSALKQMSPLCAPARSCPVAHGPLKSRADRHWQDRGQIFNCPRTGDVIVLHLCRHGLSAVTT